MHVYIYIYLYIERERTKKCDRKALHHAKRAL